MTRADENPDLNADTSGEVISAKLCILNGPLRLNLGKSTLCFILLTLKLFCCKKSENF